jgi:hypothetical protein
MLSNSEIQPIFGPAQETRRGGTSGLPQAWRRRSKFFRSARGCKVASTELVLCGLQPKGWTGGVTLHDGLDGLWQYYESPRFAAASGTISADDSSLSFATPSHFPTLSRARRPRPTQINEFLRSCSIPSRGLKSQNPVRAIAQSNAQIEHISDGSWASVTRMSGGRLTAQDVRKAKQHSLESFWSDGHHCWTNVVTGSVSLLVSWVAECGLGNCWRVCEWFLDDDLG